MALVLSTGDVLRVARVAETLNNWLKRIALPGISDRDQALSRECM